MAHLVFGRRWTGCCMPLFCSPECLPQWRPSPTVLWLLLAILSHSIVLFATKANRVINYFPSAGSSHNTWSIPPHHHICHSPLWNTLPTHKTNHPGSTHTLFLPLWLWTVASALPASDSHLTKKSASTMIWWWRRLRWHLVCASNIITCNFGKCTKIFACKSQNCNYSHFEAKETINVDPPSFKKTSDFTTVCFRTTP